VEYFKAPKGWTYRDENPFTDDGKYDFGWSCFCILDEDTDQFHTGKCEAGPFSARFGRNVRDLEQRLVDFLQYEKINYRKVILSFPAEINIDEFVNQAIKRTPKQSTIRPEDPPIVVHSTTLESWQKIREDQELKASSQLEKPRNRAGQLTEIEMYYRNEPPEYKDYILFGGVDATASEIVIASNAKGRFVMDDDAEYEPGIRLYFNNHQLIVDGLGIRDGLHLIKVRKKLPLVPSLLAAISVDDVDPDGKVKVWTLKTFVESANQAFRAMNAESSVGG
jgi:hypothetical protein